jgi:hypothetical protein
LNRRGDFVGATASGCPRVSRRSAPKGGKGRHGGLPLHGLLRGGLVVPAFGAVGWLLLRGWWSGRRLGPDGGGSSARGHPFARRFVILKVRLRRSSFRFKWCSRFAIISFCESGYNLASLIPFHQKRELGFNGSVPGQQSCLPNHREEQHEQG